MSYDDWKTTDIYHADMPSADQHNPAVPVMGGPYRGFIISFDPPPIPDRDMDWHFVHRDYDGAPDAGDMRFGHGATAADCVRQIDEMLGDGDDSARYEHETSDLSDDSNALASAGYVEE